MRSGDLKRISAVALVLVTVPILLWAAISIYTEAYSNARLNWDSTETQITAATLSSNRFGLRGSYSTSDYVYAKPLKVPNVTIGGTPRNIWIVADMSNYVYAFDAAHVGSAYLWRTQMGIPTVSRLSTLVYNGNIGCLATPTIDATNGWLFTLCSDNEQWRFSKISLSTGSVISSVVVAATYPGTGSGLTGECTSGANVVFCYPTSYAARPGLALANGNVYLSFGQADYQAWHGWFMTYSETTMAQVAAFCTTPNGNGGSIWQSGGAPAVDGSGNLYVTTGNGDYNGVTNFGMSMLKFSPAGALLDWYTPSNNAALTAADADFSAGPPFLPPGTSLAVAGGKDWNVYSVNTACMGHTGGTANGCTAPQIVSVFPGHGTVNGDTGIFGRMFMGSIGYFPTQSGPMYSLVLTGSTWATTASSTAVSYNSHGLMMAGSSNGSTSNIVWGISPNAVNDSTAANCTLRAFDAVSLAEIWNSQTLASDNLGIVPKFITPVIADGQIAVATSSGVSVFGLNYTQSGGKITLGAPWRSH